MVAETPTATPTETAVQSTAASDCVVWEAGHEDEDGHFYGNASSSRFNDLRDVVQMSGFKDDFAFVADDQWLISLNIASGETSPVFQLNAGYLNKLDFSAESQNNGILAYTVDQYDEDDEKTSFLRVAHIDQSNQVISNATWATKSPLRFLDDKAKFGGIQFAQHYPGFGMNDLVLATYTDRIEVHSSSGEQSAFRISSDKFTSLRELSLSPNGQRLAVVDKSQQVHILERFADENQSAAFSAQNLVSVGMFQNVTANLLLREKCVEWWQTCYDCENNPSFGCDLCTSNLTQAECETGDLEPVDGDKDAAVFGGITDLSWLNDDVLVVSEEVTFMRFVHVNDNYRVSSSADYTFFDTGAYVVLQQPWDGFSIELYELSMRLHHNDYCPLNLTLTVDETPTATETTTSATTQVDQSTASVPTETTTSSTTEVDQSTASVTTEVDQSTASVTTEVDQSTASVTTQVDQSTASVTTEVDQSTASVTTEVDQSTASVTTEVDQSTAFVPTETTASVTTEVDQSTASVTTETTAGATTEVAQTTSSVATETTVAATTEAVQTTSAATTETPVTAPPAQDVRIDVQVEIAMPDDAQARRVLGEAFAQSLEDSLSSEHSDTTVVFIGWELVDSSSSRRLLAEKWKAVFAFRSNSSSATNPEQIQEANAAAAASVAEDLTDSSFNSQITNSVAVALQNDSRVDATVLNSISVPEQQARVRTVNTTQDEGSSSSYNAAALVVGLVVAVLVVGGIAGMHFRNKQREKQALPHHAPVGVQQV